MEYRWGMAAISARVPGKELMVVKSSGGFYGRKQRESSITDFDGKVVSGTGRPTREALLHGYIYKISPGVGGIMHCHSPWSIAWASTKNRLIK